MIGDTLSLGLGQGRSVWGVELGEGEEAKLVEKGLILQVFGQS